MTRQLTIIGVLLMGLSSATCLASDDVVEPKVNSGKGFGIITPIEPLADPRHRQSRKFYRSMFKDNDVPKGLGVGALCIDKKVFGFSFNTQAIDFGPREFFPVQGNTQLGLQIEECEKKDYTLLGYAMTEVVKKGMRGKNYGMLKMCLASKLFYVSAWTVGSAGSSNSFVIQSIVNGKAEEC